MALWGRVIPRHTKRWHSFRLPTTNKSPEIIVRAFSNQVFDQDVLIQEAGLTQEGRISENEPKTFEELFRRSTFVSLGDPKGKLVVGTIKRIVENNIYIDFGWKFPCVCPLPGRGSGSYIPGKKVRILIKELEMATKFLGNNKEMSLNEADCILLGLLSRDSGKSVGDAQLLGDEVPAFVPSDKTKLGSSQMEKLQPINIEELVRSLKDNQEPSQETSEESKTTPDPVDPLK